MHAIMLPRHAIGIGFRHAHYQNILEERPHVDFLEVHSENFFHSGGASLHTLQRAREHYPISLHGVGLSLASADALQADHVRKLQTLAQRIEPALVSEHLCWGALGTKHYNDLLPLPYTEESLALLINRVDHLQNLLKHRVLIENLSAYIQFRGSTMHELEFLRRLSQHTGCGLLLDMNNIYVNAINFDDDPWPYLFALPATAIGEIHLAGHTRSDDCLIDTHNTTVCTEVWAWYQRMLQQVGSAPTLIEWDADLPELSVLLNEADTARQYNQPGQFVLNDDVPTHAPPREVQPEYLLQTQQAFGAALDAQPHTENIIALLKQPAHVANERLAIYRGNVVANLTSALQAAYPVCQKIVGADFFQGLVRAYRAEYPSTSGDLYEYGHRFSRFLRDFPPTQEMPYLFDVTRLEWAVHTAYAAADSMPLSLSTLADWQPEQLAEAQFMFNPGVACLSSSYPIATIWQQHQPEHVEPIDIQLDQAEHAVVHRQQWRVQVATLTGSEAMLLDQLLQGQMLGAALTHTFTQYPDCMPQSALQKFFTLGLLARIHRHTSTT